MGIFLAHAFFFLIVLADYNPFRQINGVWCHGWMAPCQVSFDVQNPRGGTPPGNRTFTGHVFLFAHGHCELQWDHTRACATDFLPHNTCGTRACCASTETTRFGLTTHPWVRYHLSFLQVHCNMIAHPCQSNGRSTKQTKFCCFCGPHALGAGCNASSGCGQIAQPIVYCTSFLRQNCLISTPLSSERGKIRSAEADTEAERLIRTMVTTRLQRGQPPLPQSHQEDRFNASA